MAKAPTHYETLGVRPDARHNEIGLAYNRLMAARRRADAPPDPKGEARLKRAFEVLSDLDRRAEYDAELVAARLRPAFGAKHGAFAALFTITVAAGAWWYIRPAEPVAAGLPLHQVSEMATAAVGRLSSVELSGELRDAGIAFAVYEGAMVASCEALTPTSELRVKIAQREVRARVSSTEPALGLCKLDVPGTGAWPLALGRDAKVGDRVYAARADAGGRVALASGTITGVGTAEAPAIDAQMASNPVAPGLPLLDVHGRVVAVAARSPEGAARYVPVPAAWAEAPVAAPSPPPRSEPEPEREAEPELINPELGPIPGNIRISPERRKRLEKAFRPPPNVPDDL